MDVLTIFGGLSYDMKIDLRSGPLTKELFDECNAYNGDNFLPKKSLRPWQQFFTQEEEEDKEAYDDGDTCF